MQQARKIEALPVEFIIADRLNLAAETQQNAAVPAVPSSQPFTLRRVTAGVVVAVPTREELVIVRFVRFPDKIGCLIEGRLPVGLSA